MTMWVAHVIFSEQMDMALANHMVLWGIGLLISIRKLIAITILHYVIQNLEISSAATLSCLFTLFIDCLAGPHRQILHALNKSCML